MRSFLTNLFPAWSSSLQSRVQALKDGFGAVAQRLKSAGKYAWHHVPDVLDYASNITPILPEGWRQGADTIIGGARNLHQGINDLIGLYNGATTSGQPPDNM